MRTFSFAFLLVSSLLNAQDDAKTDSSPPPKATSDTITGAKSFTTAPPPKTTEPRRSPGIKQDAQGDANAAPEPGQRDNNTQPGERVIIGGAPVDPKAYVIGPVDLLRITVWREPELSRDFFVRPDGKISLPLINEIDAAGLTPEGLAARVTELLSKYMLHPLVNVAVQQVNSKKYFIQGEVQKPGVYSLVVPTTVLEALVNAGGFREFANTKNILILRSTQRLRFNYKSVTNGKDLEQNILLQSGDQIIVR